MVRKSSEYEIALELNAAELVSKLQEQRTLFFVLERAEMVEGIINFFKTRQYLTDKQLKVLRIAYAEINSHELDF